jgi:hypothetical protein
VLFQGVGSALLKEVGHRLLLQALLEDPRAPGMAERPRYRDRRAVRRDFVVLDPQARAQIEGFQDLLLRLLLGLGRVVLLPQSDRSLALFDCCLIADALERLFQPIDLLLGFADVLLVTVHSPLVHLARSRVFASQPANVGPNGAV